MPTPLELEGSGPRRGRDPDQPERAAILRQPPITPIRPLKSSKPAISAPEAQFSCPFVAKYRSHRANNAAISRLSRLPKTILIRRARHRFARRPDARTPLAFSIGTNFALTHQPHGESGAERLNVVAQPTNLSASRNQNNSVSG